MKRFASLFLTICLITSICAFMPISASAATNGTCGDNLTWTIDDEGTLTISGTEDMYNYGYTGMTWNDFQTNIKNIVINSGVTSIGRYAFSHCSGLESITIPNSVTSIGDGAFSFCSGLESITIPDSVTSIRYGAFSSCNSLKSIMIPDGVTSIGDEAFSFCSGLESITIPNSVTSIGGGAFSHCSGLESITIPNSVTSIGDNAFSCCIKLESITIPDGVTSIGDEAFSSCNSLKSITIPDGVTSIGDEAFSSCNSLKSITIPDGVTSIGDGTFSFCSGLESITIPDSVTSIGDEAFYCCSSLTDVYYGGSETDWAKINMVNNEDLTNAIIHYNCKSADNMTQPPKNNPTLFADSKDTLTLGEQKWITGCINGIYSQIHSADVNIVCSDENVLSIESQDTMCMSPENDGEQYLVCANAFVKGVSPGNATLTFYYKGEKLGTTDVMVEAVIADTISDEVILKANVLHKNDRYHYYKDTASSPAILLNNQFKDGYTENLASTYLFVDDLVSALTLHLENGEELDTTTYYEILLADILENDSNGIWDKAYSTWKTMYGGYNNKIVQKVAGVVTDLDKVKTLDFIKNNKEKKVLETIIDYSNGQGVLKDVSVEVDVLDKLSLSADLVNDFFNAVDEVYAYSAVQQEKIDVLKNIQIHTANDNLKIACNNLIEDIKFAQENAVMYYATNFGKTAISDLFDFSHGMVTGLVLQYITTDTAGVTPYVPGLKEAMAIIKTGRFISNSIINADDISKNVLTVSAYADIEEEIKTYATWAENSFATNKTVDNARNLMAHADFLKATLIQSHEVYINYVEDVKKADRNLTITGNILALLRGDLRGFIDSTKDSNASYDDVIKTAERMKTGLANEDFYSTNYMDIAAFISNIQTTIPSEWAKEYINKAINEYYIVPDYLQGNYQNNITRAEFCTLLVGVLENYTGKDINTLVAEAPYNAKLFEDTYYEYIHYMACLGIVNGVSESEFNPLGEITREEAAVMLYRTALFLNHDLWPIKQPTLEGVSFWASDGVRFVMENGIMTGTDNGFEPQGKYTKEQAITTFVRFLQNLK